MSRGGHYFVATGLLAGTINSSRNGDGMMDTRFSVDRDSSPGSRLRRRNIWRQGASVHARGQQRRARCKRLIDLCLDAGVNLFDTADVYSTVLQNHTRCSHQGRRNRVIVSTKLTLRRVQAQ